MRKIMKMFAGSVRMAALSVSVLFGLGARGDSLASGGMISDKVMGPCILRFDVTIYNVSCHALLDTGEQEAPIVVNFYADDTHYPSLSSMAWNDTASFSLKIYREGPVDVRWEFFAKKDAYKTKLKADVVYETLPLQENWLRLTASKDDEPDAVSLKWSSNPSGGLYRVYRDGQLIDTVSGMSYIDRKMTWEVNHQYYVVRTDQDGTSMTSNTDNGWTCTLPRLCDVDIARLWLSGEGPYNIRMHWNDYDPAKVRVDNIRFKLVRKEAGNSPLSFEPTANFFDEGKVDGYDLSLANLGQGHFCIQAGGHGEYDLCVCWNAKAVSSGSVLSDEDYRYVASQKMRYQDPQKAPRVFFHKFNKDADGIANWYRYWINDGAIKGGLFAMQVMPESNYTYDGKFRYNAQENKYRGRTSVTPFDSDFSEVANISPPVPSAWDKCWRLLYGVPRMLSKLPLPKNLYPKLFKLTRERQLAYQVTDLGACSGDVFAEDGTAEYTGPMVGMGSVGLRKFADLVKHEHRHGELIKGLFSHVGGLYVGVVPDWLKDANYRGMVSILEDLRDRYGATPYYNELKRAYDERPCKIMLDTDGDGVSDATEISERFYGTCEWIADTHKLSSFPNMGGYMSYGDNELRARDAESGAEPEIDMTCDWAFPGSQIAAEYQGYLPFRVERRPDLLVWDEERRNEVKSQLQGFDVGERASARVKLAVVADDPDEDLSTISFPLSGPLVFPDDAALPVFGVDVSDRPLCDGVEGARQERLRFRVTVTNGLEETLPVRVTGYLTDGHGTPVAYARRDVEAPYGTSEVELAFAGRHLRSGGLRDFELRQLKLEYLGADGPEVIASRAVHVPTPYSAADFVGDGVALDTRTITDRVENGDLLFDIGYEAFASRDFSLVACLSDTNGVYLAHAEVPLTEGRNTATLRFDGSAIFETRVNGPYLISLLQVKEGPKTLNGKSNAYQTKDLSCVAFAPQGWTPPPVEFALPLVSVKEGESIELTVNGGAGLTAASAALQLVYNTATAADLDFSKTLVDGVPVKGFKFPYVLTWTAGELVPHTLRIPVRTDTAVEDREMLTFQLVSPQGTSLGTNRVATVRIEDLNDFAALQDGAANPNVKLTTTGSDKWIVRPGNRDDSDSPSGLFHVQSPSLQPGQTAKLVCAAQKTVGYMYFDIRFVGDSEEAVSARVDVYCGNQLIGSIRRADADGVWEEYYATVRSKGLALSFVYVQGSDPETHVEISRFCWDDGSAPQNVCALTHSPEGGYVSGSGQYPRNATAKLVAKPRPGWTFAGWYLETNVGRTLYSTKTSLSLKVTEPIRLFADFTRQPYLRVFADPIDAGKVSGGGYCQPGKKITLKATANKGYVFRGWYAGCIVEDPLVQIPLSKSATYVLAGTPTEDIDIVAAFITADCDKSHVAARVNGVVLEPWVSKVETHAAFTNVWAGVNCTWPVSVETLSEATVKVTGLPAGLKFTEKPVTAKLGSGKDAVTVTNVPANTIYGVPTSPSKVDKTGKTIPSSVMMTVTTSGKSTRVYQIDTAVDALPERVQGSFFGGSTNGVPGSATLTVSAAGKISGKWVSNGSTWTLGANSFGAYDAETGGFYATLTAKTGKLVEELPIVIGKDGVATTDVFDALWANWKIMPWKAEAKAFDKQVLVYETDSGATVRLKFSATGVATVTGEFPNGVDRYGKPVFVKASGSATLVPTDSGFEVFVYLTPKGLPPYACCRSVEFVTVP